MQKYLLVGTTIKAPFIWRKVVPGRRVTRLPKLPSGRANFSYISLQNLANRLHEKLKVGSAGRVTCLAWSPFFNGRVTLLAGPTFLHVKHLRSPSRFNSVKARQALLAWAKGSTFFSYKHLLKLTRLGG